MIYHFRAISDESDDFLFDIAIDSSSTFLDLNNFIQEKLEYDSSHLSSFFITDEEWNKETEIIPMDMGDDIANKFLMEDAILESLLINVKQRFIYVFDLFNERILFMELAQIDEGKLKSPICTKLQGTPPVQIVEEEFDGDISLGYEGEDDYDFDEELFSDDIDFDSYSEDSFDDDFY